MHVSTQKALQLSEKLLEHFSQHAEQGRSVRVITETIGLYL
jgi:hypothetical protein